MLRITLEVPVLQKVPRYHVKVVEARRKFSGVQICVSIREHELFASIIDAPERANEDYNVGICSLGNPVIASLYV
jgi:hypothetical protein